MRVERDPDRCDGHGVCAAIAPEVFELDDDGDMHVTTPEPPDRFEEQVRRAVASCPKLALTITG